MESKVKDMGLAEQGRLKIEWAESRMPVLMELRKKYSETKPFKGITISGSIHVTKETAVLLRTLRDAGANLAWSGCNPLSTQDDVAAAIAADGIGVYAWHGMDRDEFYDAIHAVIEEGPDLCLDDGGDLIFTLHAKYPEIADNVIGGTEETTTGVHRFRAMDRDGKLKFPLVAVNDAETKWDFDNTFGTGQSSLDGILRATSVLYAGKKFVVSGYGHCGRGIAIRARGMGCNVIVTEVEPIKSLKAAMEGFSVMTMDDAAAEGDIFITATGMKDVITGRHFEVMKDGAVVCNTGHYDCEINIDELEALAGEPRTIRENNEEYTMPDGRRIYLLAKGRLVNLAAAEGHPSEVMDMSFANQFMSLLWLAQQGKGLEKKVYDVPVAQDREIARTKLQTMGISIDSLSSEQEAYITDYSAGT